MKVEEKKELLRRLQKRILGRLKSQKPISSLFKSFTDGVNGLVDKNKNFLTPDEIFDLEENLQETRSAVYKQRKGKTRVKKPKNKELSNKKTDVIHEKRVLDLPTVPTDEPESHEPTDNRDIDIETRLEELKNFNALTCCQMEVFSILLPNLLILSLFPLTSLKNLLKKSVFQSNPHSAPKKIMRILILGTMKRLIPSVLNFQIHRNLQPSPKFPMLLLPQPF